MTRIERARRQVSIAKIAIGATAVAALATFAAAARASHPGTHPAVTTGSSSQAATPSFDGQFYGGGSIGPSGSAEPQIESGAS